MPLFLKARSFLRNLFATRRMDKDLDEEVQSHLDMRHPTGSASTCSCGNGAGAAEAQRAARIELGGIEQVKEQVREQRIGNWLQSVFADCRFALRQLRKSPAFTAVAVLTLALGIGANTAIFSLLDPLLLRKLPVHHPDELVWVNSAGTLGPAEISEMETFELYRDKADVFSSVLAFSRVAPYAVTHDGRTSLATGELVSGNYFTALGVSPIGGRFFDETDEHSRAFVVLSFDFWKREFDSDPKAIGRVVHFGDQADASRTGSSAQYSYTVLGIAPPGFFGTAVGESPDFYCHSERQTFPRRIIGKPMA